MEDNRASLVRDRLERLMKEKKPVFRPVDDVLGEPEPAEEKQKVITPEVQFQRKIDKAISNIESLKKRMNEGNGNYLSLIYDIRKAEDEFLSLLDKEEMQFLDLPEVFMKRIEETKAKIRRR